MDLQEPRSAESLTEAKRAIEAILLVSSEPTPAQLLAQLLEFPLDVVDQLLGELQATYDEAHNGFQLVEVAGGWRYQTHPDLAPYVERFAMEGQSTRLSSAALETMAIVAYKQPISRAQVSAIRGVNVDAVLRTLVQRGYVEEIGRDSGAGQAVLFGTTDYFLERLGLPSTSDLPALGEFVPSAEVVEALEQTLRVNLDDEPDVAIDDEAALVDGVSEADVSLDDEVEGLVDDEPELVIDLTDGSVDELTADRNGAEVEQPAEDAVIDLTDNGSEPIEGEAAGIDDEVEASTDIVEL